MHNEDEKTMAGERKYLTSLRLTCWLRVFGWRKLPCCIMERRWSELRNECSSVTLFHLALLANDREYLQRMRNNLIIFRRISQLSMVKVARVSKCVKLKVIKCIACTWYIFLMINIYWGLRLSTVWFLVELSFLHEFLIRDSVPFLYKIYMSYIKDRMEYRFH